MGGGGTKDFTIYIHGNTNPLDQQIEKLSKRTIKFKMDVDTKSLNSVLQKMDHMIADVEKSMGGLDFGKIFGTGFNSKGIPIQNMQANIQNLRNLLKSSIAEVNDLEGETTGAMKVTTVGGEFEKIAANTEGMVSGLTGLAKNIGDVNSSFEKMAGLVQEIKGYLDDLTLSSLAPKETIQKELNEVISSLEKFKSVEEEMASAKDYLTSNKGRNAAKRSIVSSNDTNKKLLQQMEVFTRYGGDLSTIQLNKAIIPKEVEGRISATITNCKELYDVLVKLNAVSEKGNVSMDQITSNIVTNKAMASSGQKTVAKQIQEAHAQKEKLSKDLERAGIKEERDKALGLQSGGIGNANIEEFVNSMNEAIGKLSEAQGMVTELQSKLSEAIHVDKPLDIPVEPEVNDFVGKVQSAIQGQNVKVGVELDTNNIVNSSSFSDKELGKIAPFSKNLKDIDVSYLKDVNFEDAKENQLYSIYTQRVKDAYEAFGVKNYKKNNIDISRTKKLQSMDTPENKEIMRLFSKRDNTFTEEDLRNAEKYNVSLENALGNLNKFWSMYHSDYDLRAEDYRDAMMYLQQALIKTESIGQSPSWLGTQMKNNYGILDGLKGIRSKIESKWTPDDQSIKTLNILKSGVTSDKSLLGQFSKDSSGLYSKGAASSSIEIPVVPTGLDTFVSSIQSAVQAKPIEVGVAIGKNSINASEIESLANGINVNIGSLGSNNPIRHNEISGIAKRDAIKQLAKQRDAIEQEFLKQYQRPDVPIKYAKPEDAVMSASASYKDAWALAQMRFDTQDKSLPLIQRMEALNEYINFLKEVAQEKNIDLSGVLSRFKDADEIIENANNIITGRQNVKQQKGDTAIKDNKDVARTGNVVGVPKIEESSFVSDIQSSIGDQKVEVGFKPLAADADTFISSIQSSLTGKKVEITVAGVKDESDTTKGDGGGGKPPNPDEKGKGEGEGRGNMYRGMTKDVFLKNYDLSKYNETFNKAGLGDFKKLISFGEDGDAVLSFNDGLAETIVRFEDLVEVTEKLKAGTFGLDDFKNSYTQLDQDAVKSIEALERKEELKSQILDKSATSTEMKDYESALKAQMQGINLTKEQEAALERVRQKYAEIGNMSYSGLKDESLLQYYANVESKSEDIARSVFNKQQTSVAKIEDRPEIEGYSDKLKQINSDVAHLSSMLKTIDWSNPEDVKVFSDLVNNISKAKSELKGLEDQYKKSQKESKPAAKAVTSMVDQNKLYDQKAKEMSKISEDATKEMFSKTFSGDVEGLGKVTDIKFKGDGAIITYLNTVDDKIVETKVKIESLKDAMSQLNAGTFADYAKYNVQGRPKEIKMIDEDQQLLEQYKDAKFRQWTGQELTNIDTGSLDAVRAKLDEIAAAGSNATSQQLAFKQAVESVSMQSITKDQLAGDLANFTKLSNKEGMTKSYKAQVQEIIDKINEINSMSIDPDDTKQMADYAMHREQLSQMISEFNMASSEKGYGKQATTMDIAKLNDRLATLKTFNSKAAKGKFAGEFDNIQKQINGLSDLNDKVDIRDVNAQITTLSANLQNAGQAGMSFGDTWKQRMGSLAAYLSTFASFYRIIGVIKQTANTVRELDTALTEMRKVSDESLQSLQNYQKGTFDTAKTIGTTALQLQQSTADWMRLKC